MLRVVGFFVVVALLAVGVSALVGWVLAHKDVHPQEDPALDYLEAPDGFKVSHLEPVEPDEPERLEVLEPEVAREESVTHASPEIRN